MQLVQDWLTGLNLQKKGGSAQNLEGEALTYAVVAFLVRSDALPQEIVVALAEGYFGRIMRESGTH